MIVSGIYRIRNTVNGKFYVGSALNVAKRFYSHRYALRKKEHYNQHLQNSWNKYGEQSFTFEMIEHVSDTDIIVEREQYWLDELEAVKKGYNMCPIAGSCLNREFSEETRIKLSIANKGKNNPMYGRRGEDNPRHGQKHSDEAKARMSAAMKGRTLSEEHRKKISAIHKGKVTSEETKKKMSLAHKGGKNPMYGKPISDEHRARLSASRKGAKNHMYGKRGIHISPSTEFEKGHKLSDETKRKISEGLKRAYSEGRR